MRTLRVLHFADVHLDDSTLPNSLAALARIVQIAEDTKPDLIVNAGDLAMRRGHLAPWVAFELRNFHARLAAIAPVIVVEGNHDMVHDDRAGTVLGALALTDCPFGRLTLVTTPRVVKIQGVPAVIACLPYPSKKRLMASSGVSGSTANDTMAMLLQQVAEGLAIEAESTADAGPRILVFHGSLEGAEFGDERLMTTEMDALLSESAISPTFGAIMCGHIHKPQPISARAAYCGSPTPLGFSEEKYQHGVMLWDYILAYPSPPNAPGSGRWERNFISIAPVQELLTIDLRADTPHGMEVETLTRIRAAELIGDPARTRARVLVNLGRQQSAADATAVIERVLAELGVHDCKVVIERQSADLSTEVGDGVTNDGQIDAMLDLWKERSPEAAENMATLREIAHTIETGLPLEARNAKNAAEYTLESIEVSNWKSYGPGPMRLDLTELGRLIVVEGENASGKSNLMEAEAFALWGRTIRGRQTLAELVRKGQTDARVRAVFQSAGERWMVDRALKMKSDGTAAADLSLLRWIAEPTNASFNPATGDAQLVFRENWAPASGGTARETEVKLEALVGSLELYLSTRFASQGDVDRILSLSGAELKDTLQQALNTGIFVMREAAGAVVVKDRERAAQLTIADFTRAEVKATVVPDLEKRVAENNVELEGVCGDLAGARERATAAEQAVGAAEGALKTVAVRRESFRLARAAVAAREQELARITARDEPLRRQVSEGQLAALALTDLDMLRERIVELERATEGQRAARLNLHALTEAATQARDHRDRVRRQADQAKQEREAEAQRAGQLRERSGTAAADAVRRAEARVTQVTEDMDRAEGAIAARTARAHLAPFGEKCVEAKCPMLADAIAAKDEIEPQNKRRHAAIAEARAAVVTAQAERNQVIETNSAEHTRLQDVHSTARQALGDLLAVAARSFDLAEERRANAEKLIGTESIEEGELREFREKYNGTPRARLEERRAEGQAANAMLSALIADMDRVKCSITDATAALTELGPEPDDTADRDRLTDARDKAQAMRGRVAMLDALRMDIAEKAAQLGQQLSDAKAAAVEVERLRVRLREDRHMLEVANLYLMAVGKNGLPYMILERALPSLERHANAFLGSDAGDVDLRVEIEPFREIGTGEKRTEVMIRYRNRFGLHALAAASGFERAALGYALRAAMAQVQAEAHGIKVTHFIADEGWGAFDERNLLMGQRMLQRMADEFRQVIYISHVGTIREIAEARVLVTPDGEKGSTFEVRQ